MEKQLDKQNGLKSHMEMSINNLEAEVEEKQVGNGEIKDEVLISIVIYINAFFRVNWLY